MIVKRKNRKVVPRTRTIHAPARPIKKLYQRPGLFVIGKIGQIISNN
jgi:hypothetical protein